MILDELIVFSCNKDASTWKIAGPRILKRIPAKKYTLIVPDEDLDVFHGISNKQFEIEAESIYSSGVYQDILRRIPDDKRDSVQWYSQQFIKLLAASKRSSEQSIAIWDGDTAPLKPIQFIDSQGRLNYFTGTEAHDAYFETIQRLLGINKLINVSFIAQCFALKVSWIHRFINEIESRSGKTWTEAILESIDFTQENAFSEYETLGTFITHHYPKEINLLSAPWYRLGNSLIGDAQLIDSKLAIAKLTPYHYVSFEVWDRPKPHLLKSSLPIFLEKKIKPVLQKLRKKKWFGYPYKQYQLSKGILEISSGVGIFSCCTLRLEEILKYFNAKHSTPKLVDCHDQFGFYKDGLDTDISQDLFAVRNDVVIAWNGKQVTITDSLDEQQFSNYQELNFKEVSPFIEKYFSPTEIISNAIAGLKSSSKIDYKNTCVIRFRGTDKEAETVQPSFEQMLNKALELKSKNLNLRFAIQTDDTKFRTFIFDALGKDCFSVEKTAWAGWDGNKDYIDFYASILLLSKCKYIITTSGNGELWMMLFRGHANGVYQYLQHKELVYGKLNKSYRSEQTSFWIESA